MSVRIRTSMGPRRRALPFSGLLFGAALALAVTAAPAEDNRSANEMMPGCRAFANRRPPPPGDMFPQACCAGIVRGLSSAGVWAGGVERDARSTTTPSAEMAYMRRYLCLDIPDEVTINQQVRVVVAYIDARPARLHEFFDFLAFEALQAA
jgi:hypothetical protein